MDNPKLSKFKSQVISKALSSLSENDQVSTSMYLYNDQTEDMVQINCEDFGSEDEFLHTSLQTASKLKPSISILLGLTEAERYSESDLFVVVIQGDTVSQARCPVSLDQNGKKVVRGDFLFVSSSIENTDYNLMPILRRFA